MIPRVLYFGTLFALVVIGDAQHWPDDACSAALLALLIGLICGKAGR